MKVFAIIGLSIGLMGLLFSFRMLIRNQLIYKFLKECNELTYQWDMKHIQDSINYKNHIPARVWFWGKLPDYSSLMFSLKKLRLESFFNSDEINEIKNI